LNRPGDIEPQTLPAGESAPPLAARLLIRSRRFALPLILPFLILIAVAPGRAAGPTESEVRAAFLYKFTAYTDWPSQSFARADAPIVMGVFADERFARTLVSIVGTNRVRGRPVVVRRLQTTDEAKECHLIFFAAAESARLPNILPVLRSQPALLVGEGDKFCRDGGMIALRPKSGRMRFEVDVVRIQSAGMKISSQVIQLSIPPGRDD
jgi:hypothetical protein